MERLKSKWKDSIKSVRNCGHQIIEWNRWPAGAHCPSWGMGDHQITQWRRTVIWCAVCHIRNWWPPHHPMKKNSHLVPIVPPKEWVAITSSNATSDHLVPSAPLKDWATTTLKEVTIWCPLCHLRTDHHIIQWRRWPSVAHCPTSGMGDHHIILLKLTIWCQVCRLRNGWPPHHYMKEVTIWCPLSPHLRNGWPTHHSLKEVTMWCSLSWPSHPSVKEVTIWAPLPYLKDVWPPHH